VGTQETNLRNYQMLIGQYPAWIQMGIASQVEMANAVRLFVEELGYKNTTEFVFSAQQIQQNMQQQQQMQQMQMQMQMQMQQEQAQMQAGMEQEKLKIEYMKALGAMDRGQNGATGGRQGVGVRSQESAVVY
jgi:hypothetical protein